MQNSAVEDGDVSSIRRVPLARLFPEVSESGLGRVLHAGVAIDYARANNWQWAWSAGGNWSTFSMCHTEHYRDGDEYEVELEVANHSTEGTRTVEATVTVGCWCEKDHYRHTVAEVRHECHDGTAVVTAFEQTAAQIIAWLQDTHNPVHLRTRARLPSRTVT
jgi:hypothetical protein